MSYSVLFTQKAKKQLSKLDRNTAKLIASWLKKNLEGIELTPIFAPTKGRHLVYLVGQGLVSCPFFVNIIVKIFFFLPYRIHQE